jgi:hypothetical protein
MFIKNRVTETTMVSQITAHLDGEKWSKELGHPNADAYMTYRVDNDSPIQISMADQLLISSHLTHPGTHKLTVEMWVANTLLQRRTFCLRATNGV